MVTCGYLPYARVLAASFREHNPQARFVALLVDGHGSGRALLRPDEPFELLSPEQIGIPRGELDARGLMYTPTELVCSLRPALLRHVLENVAGAAILMDGDGRVYGELAAVAAQAQGAGLLFTPHLLSPHDPPVDEESLELVQIGYGTLNGGFLAAGRQAGPFLGWLEERLARHCLNAPERGFYLDQRWLDLALGMFDGELLRDRGCNVMCLNLVNRDIVWSETGPALPETPLRYFHFLLGFDPCHPEQICDERFSRRWLPFLNERPGAGRLAREYAAELLSAGFEQARAEPQHYERLPGGVAVDRHVRAAYRTALMRAEAGGTPVPPNPYEDGSPERFLEFLLTPSDGSRLSPSLQAVRALRADLAQAFPRVPGEDEFRFLEWVEAERAGEWVRAYAPLAG